MLMLHGYMSCKESFFYSISYFSRFYRVTAPDFPGFGASSPIPAAWSVGDYAAWLKDFISAAGMKRPHVIAHSFGARVAIKLAAAYPQLFGRMVITGGAGVLKPRTRAYRRRVAAYRLVKKFAPRLAEKKFGSAEYKKLCPLMRESYKKIVNEDLLADAGKIQIPVLLVYGAEDTVTPAAEEGLAFARAMPHGRLAVIEGGHFAFSQNHNVFNSTAAHFFAGNGDI